MRKKAKEAEIFIEENDAYSYLWKIIDKTKHPFTVKGSQYAIDVVEGNIVACVEIKGACQRYLNDMRRIVIYPEDCPFSFAPEKSERFLRLSQKFKHVIGRWKNPYIVFEPWQCFLFLNIMGFLLVETGERRFRTTYIARKGVIYGNI